MFVLLLIFLIIYFLALVLFFSNLDCFICWTVLAVEIGFTWSPGRVFSIKIERDTKQLELTRIFLHLRPRLLNEIWTSFERDLNENDLANKTFKTDFTRRLPEFSEKCSDFRKSITTVQHCLQCFVLKLPVCSCCMWCDTALGKHVDKAAQDRIVHENWSLNKSWKNTIHLRTRARKRKAHKKKEGG